MTGLFSREFDREAHEHLGSSGRFAIPVLFGHGQIVGRHSTKAQNMNGLSLKRKMTDVELCIDLVPEAGDDYRRALDVMTAYPDYAKTKFRIVVEHLTSMLAKHFRIDIERLDLYQSINELHACQVIDHGMRTELHAIRKAGNEVVHSKRAQGIKLNPVDESADTRGTGDSQSAVATREKLVGVFERIFLMLNGEEELPEIATVEIGDLTSQQTLWKAVSTLDFDSKMAAGLILEAQSLAPLPKGVMIVAHSEYAHKQTIVKMAAQMYWAACELSAGVDRFSLHEIIKMGGEEACLFRYANTEALFQFSQLTFDGPEGEESQRLGVKALEVAADRGYAAACAGYGNLLREKGRFDEAFELLSRAAEKGDISGYAGLGFLYLEKSYTNYSKKLAEQCFMEGIARGSNHCEYLLGRCLYEGTELDQDKDRGKGLLKTAADAGHEVANRYFETLVDDKLAKRVQQQFLKLALSLPIVKAPQKQRRNELCECGSGKKYKKCCGA